MTKTEVSNGTAFCDPTMCYQLQLVSMWPIALDIPSLPDLRRQLSDDLYEKLLAENTADSKEDNIEQVNEIMAVQT